MQVMNGSPAERAGLAANDVLIAMAGFSVSKAEIEGYLERFSDQASINIHYFRLGQLQQSELTIEPAPQDTAVLSVIDDVALDAWLGIDDIS